MDSFADYLVCINERVKDEIKVAVIDDGINGFDKRIADRIDPGVSFCRYSDANLMNAYFVPSGGHGTTMSSLICRVFPKAKLLIARLDEYRQPETGKRVITARSATEAIRWAISKGAHVISMSWTIDSRGNDHDIQELRKIIKEAQTDHGTIMFCAFSDQGNVHAENCVPASCPETITIGAATSWASPCTWVDSDSVDYLFPGEHVLIDRHAKPGTQSKSGSSIATALAAGLAALLLHITQLAKPAYYPAIRSKEGIKAAFEKMAAKNKYVHVRSHFHLDFQENAFWQWEAQGREKLATLVSNLVVDPEVGLFA
ncbi:peptidase S8/S53 domain-containing protein [Aspergillus lucknowensis]|uniref:Alkaline protease 1 n=1 Tax=Aspergillus lucknowensis TaxID=176173 RepID=A0ABR4LCG6_9EURO